MSDIFDEIKKFDSLPQQNLLSKINNLKCSEYIFRVNFGAIYSYFELIENPKVFIHLWDIKKRERVSSLLLEISRLLNNFLSAAKALIDHTRVFVADVYEDHPFYNEYNQEIKEKFSNQEQSAFIQGLRNYSLHKKIPIIGAKLDLGTMGQNTITHSIHLDKKSLQQWDGWNKTAKLFIEKQNEHIDLKNIVTDYHQLIRVFYDWFYGRIKEIHKDELDELEKQRSLLYKQMKNEKIISLD